MVMANPFMPRLPPTLTVSLRVVEPVTAKLPPTSAELRISVGPNTVKDVAVLTSYAHVDALHKDVPIDSRIRENLESVL